MDFGKGGYQAGSCYILFSQPGRISRSLTTLNSNCFWFFNKNSLVCSDSESFTFNHVEKADSFKKSGHLSCPIFFINSEALS